MGLLSACGLPMSENVQVEELLRAPRLPGDYGALQNALNEWLGESAQLKYPMQGELLSPFLLFFFFKPLLKLLFLFFFHIINRII